MRSSAFWFFLFLCDLAHAGSTPVVSFYRAQQSLFPSGQATREALENKIIRRDFEPWFRVRWNKKEYEIPGETVVVDKEVTLRLLATSKFSLLKAPAEGAGAVTTIQAKTSLNVLRTQRDWAEVWDPQTRLQGWAPFSVLEAPFEDTGVFMTLIDTFLRKTPQASSEIITTVPRLLRVSSLGFENNYLKVTYQGHTGYLDLANLAGRADFAMWAFHKKKGWLGISHRENGFLVTVQNLKLPLEDFKAFNPYTDRGVISQKLADNAPSIRSRVVIANSEAHRWALSQLEGHGPVWWRLESPEAVASKIPKAKSLTSEQLLKREVVSVAFAGKTLKGLASAGGVFRTDDGKTWYQIPLFESKNHPVTIHPDGIWYVGSYRSHDEGKTFEPYIKWDQLAEQIQSKLHKTPRHLRITQIEALSNSRIRIQVDTGVQKVKMQAHVLSTQWSIVR